VQPSDEENEKKHRENDTSSDGVGTYLSLDAFVLKNPSESTLDLHEGTPIVKRCKLQPKGKEKAKQKSLLQFFSSTNVAESSLVEAPEKSTGRNTNHYHLSTCNYLLNPA
jgi:hypothetical protein